MGRRGRRGWEEACTHEPDDTPMPALARDHFPHFFAQRMLDRMDARLRAIFEHSSVRLGVSMCVCVCVCVVAMRRDDDPHFARETGRQV